MRYAYKGNYSKCRQQNPSQLNSRIYPLLVCATVSCVLTALSVYCALNSAPAFILADLALAQILTQGQY